MREDESDPCHYPRLTAPSEGSSMRIPILPMETESGAFVQAKSIRPRLK